jgi:hypothetical protein
MNAKSSLLAVAATLSFGLTVPCHAASTQSGPQVIGWVSFDVPNSTYTQGSAINDLGEVAGDYADVNGIFHSFLRKRDGTIIPFDPPGAGTGTNASGIVSVPTGINDHGDVVGYYADSSTPYAGIHGYVRWKNGTFTTFDDPDSNSSPVNTTPYAINDLGDIVGSYSTASTFYGFLRKRDGSFVSIGGPARSVGSYCLDINIEGEIACGYDFLVNDFGTTGSFIRSPDGKIATFVAPGEASTAFGTNIGCTNSCGGYVGAPALNLFGAITGYYGDANNALHGYVRHANGSFDRFSVQGSTFTVPASINWLGTVVGSYVPAGAGFPSLPEAFVRFANGAIVPFAAPEKGQLGTEPFAVNGVNQFTGYWLDGNFVGHGFVARALPR